MWDLALCGSTPKDAKSQALLVSDVARWGGLGRGPSVMLTCRRAQGDGMCLEGASLPDMHEGKGKDSCICDTGAGP